jgi:hypothetical protein
MTFYPEHEVLLNAVQRANPPLTVTQLIWFAEQRGVDEQDARSALWELIDNQYLELTNYRRVELGSQRRTL